MTDHQTRIELLQKIGLIKVQADIDVAANNTPKFSDEQLEFLAKPVSEMPLSNGARIMLQRQDIHYIYQLLSYPQSDIKREAPTQLGAHATRHVGALVKSVISGDSSASHMGAPIDRLNGLVESATQFAKQHEMQEILEKSTFIEGSESSKPVLSVHKAESDVFEYLEPHDSTTKRNRDHYYYGGTRNCAQISLERQKQLRNREIVQLEGVEIEHVDTERQIADKLVMPGIVLTCADPKTVYTLRESLNHILNHWQVDTSYSVGLIQKDENGAGRITISDHCLETLAQLPAKVPFDKMTQWLDIKAETGRSIAG